MNEKKILLQNLLIKDDDFSSKMNKMLIRGDFKKILSKDNYHSFEPGVYDFSTYFNSLSVKKWKHYTNAQNFSLEFEAIGDFSIEVYGHYCEMNDVVRTKKIAFADFKMQNKENSILLFEETDYELISFKMIVNKKTHIYRAGYFSYVPPQNIRKIDLALLTTTFKKEKYIFKNYEIINKNLFSDKNIGDNLQWLIIDNGRSDELKNLNSEKVMVFPNKNVGGAGGAARGIIEANRLKQKPTHILIMDDDVKFIASSFKKLFVFLSLLKEKYASNSFIAGAMLEMERPYFQHEDIGTITKDAVVGSAKAKLDMTKLNNIVLNERFLKKDCHQYSAWWFCCIPMNIATTDNLPLPLFLRDDDIEYSIRNKAHIISMNGICIWHNRFEGRFSFVTDIYQSFKNELIISAIHDNLKDIAFFKKINDIFWQELFKFNYSSAWLIAKALEDYLKGPDYLSNLDAAANIKSKKKKEPLLKPITKSLHKKIDYNDLYLYEPLSLIKKTIYDYTCNGQKRFPFPKTGKSGVIPYGWGYYQKKMYMCDKVYAIDSINNTFTVYKKNKKQFNLLSEKFNKLTQEFIEQNNKITDDYKKAFTYLSSIKYWKTHLGIE